MRDRPYGFQSEQELAALVVNWLASEGWEVYQEVQIARAGRIADIVATTKRGSVTLLWLIECKLSFTLDLISQAASWVGLAHWVSVAVPYTRRTSRGVMGVLLDHYGLGVLRISGAPRSQSPVVLERSPRLCRHIGKSLQEGLCEPQRTFAAAGNPNGQRWSPWKQTLALLREHVAAHPGCSMKDALKQIRHHYSSDSTARSSLVKWIELNRVPGVTLQRDGRHLMLYPGGPA